jgi:hypothetical protein
MRIDANTLRTHIRNIRFGLYAFTLYDALVIQLRVMSEIHEHAKLVVHLGTGTHNRVALVLVNDFGHLYSRLFAFIRVIRGPKKMS